ncbi:autophagy-related protein 101 [Colias croceus]|uniref:autophagy-related protein 101 n=1 Tax=Colias crocea TaxID=72248 RepID=UPI001E27F805|nr:autophagy-related protein 101 [Colias croceus]
MNARDFNFEIAMDGSQVDEVVASIFHTVLFHRSSGKFTYNNEESYSIRTVNYVDVDCDFIDFTYVCCASETLVRRIKREISIFSKLLRTLDGRPSPAKGEISLEFFQKHRTRWFLPTYVPVPWEIWRVSCELTESGNDQDMHSKHESVVEMLQDQIVFITEIINRHEYVPKMPNRSDADLIFDTSYPDIQPYLFAIKYKLPETESNTVGNTVRKLIRDTLSL